MKFFPKEVKIALTAIVAVIIIYLGILFLKGTSLAGSNNTYMVEMDDVSGLAVDAPVLVNGVAVGTVKELTFQSEKQNVLLKIELKEDVKLPRGSKAALDKSLLGATKLKIVLGDNKKGVLDVNSTIYGMKNNDLMSSAADMMPKVNDIMIKVDTLVAQINNIANSTQLNGTLNNLYELSTNLEEASKYLPTIAENLNTTSVGFKQLTNTTDNNSVVNNLQSTMKNINEAAQSINKMSNNLNASLPTLLNTANDIGNNLQQTTSQLSQMELNQLVNNLNATVENLSTLTHTINDAVNNPNSSLGLLMSNPNIYNELDSTLHNASLLLEDLRNNPKNYVHFSLFGRKNK